MCAVEEDIYIVCDGQGVNRFCNGCENDVWVVLLSISFVDAAAMVDSQPVPGEQLLI